MEHTSQQEGGWMRGAVSSVVVGAAVGAALSGGLLAVAHHLYTLGTPWTTIAGAAVIGGAVGWLVWLMRRSNRR